MKKIITRYGNAYVIRLTPEERKLNGDLEEGDIVNITITEVEKPKDKKKKT